MIYSSSDIEKESFIQQKCKNKNVLDLGCIRHDSSFSTNPNWLHNKIKNVADKVIGVDYLEGEVAKLQNLGYNIIYGDVTKPLNLSETFDIIIAGDLIEHLSNFEGFFKNCEKFLKKDGIIILSTPNPFYVGEFLYVALKNTYFVNPEHTCWIDPLTLSQLVKRFNFIIQELHFVRKKWHLESFISENQDYYYDILKEKWIERERLSKIKKIERICKLSILKIISKIMSPILSSRMKLVNYSDYIAVLKLKSEL